MNFTGGGAGEISFSFEIPTDYQDWEDFFAPHAQSPGADNTFVQSFTDTIRVTFRLRAESRPEGSISTTGGEAIACAGQSSPLGGFDLDPGVGGLNCGSGFTINASVGQTGTVVQLVPEPATLAMLTGALLGVGWAVRRRGRR